MSVENPHPQDQPLPLAESDAKPDIQFLPKIEKNMQGEWKTDDDVQRPGGIKTMEQIIHHDVMREKNQAPQEGEKPEQPKKPEEKDKAPEVSDQQLKSSLAKLGKAIDTEKNPEFDHRALRLLVAEKELAELGTLLKDVDFRGDKAQKELVPVLEGWAHYAEGGGLLRINMEDDYVYESENTARNKQRPAFDNGSLVLAGYDAFKGERSPEQEAIGSIAMDIVYRRATPEEAAEDLAQLNKMIKDASGKQKWQLIGHADFVFRNCFDDLVAPQGTESWEVAFDKKTGHFDFTTYDAKTKTFVKRKVSGTDDAGAQKILKGINDGDGDLKPTPVRPPKTVAPNDADVPGTPIPEAPVRPPKMVDPSPDDALTPVKPPKTVAPNDEDAPGTPVTPEKPIKPKQPKTPVKPPQMVAPNDDDAPGTPVTQEKPKDPEELPSLEEQAFDMAYEDAIRNLDERVEQREENWKQTFHYVERLKKGENIGNVIVTAGGLLGPTTLQSMQRLLSENMVAWNIAKTQRESIESRFGKKEGDVKERLADIRGMRVQCGLLELPQNAAKVLKLSKDERNAIANAPLDRGDPDYESVLAELRGGIQTLSRFQSILEMIDNGVGITAGSVPGGGLIYSLSRNLTDVVTGTKPPKKAAFDFCWGYIAGKIGSSIATRSGAVKFAEKWAEKNASLFTAKAGAAVDGLIGSLVEKGGQKIVGDKI